MFSGDLKGVALFCDLSLFMAPCHERGSEVLVGVRRDHNFALRCVSWLLSKQDTDELSQGTSLRRNDVGLSKAHAAQVDKTSPVGMSHAELIKIASSYTHTQLAKGVDSGELVLPDPVTRKRRRLLMADESDTDLDSGSGSESDSANARDIRGISLDVFGIQCAGLPICMPSRRFVTRVGNIVERVRRADCTPPWTFADVRERINEEDGWLGVEIDVKMVDAALYYALPAVNWHSKPRPAWIRVWWAAESIWADARVDRVSGANTTESPLRVDLSFPAENTSAFITGADTSFVYALE